MMLWYSRVSHIRNRVCAFILLFQNNGPLFFYCFLKISVSQVSHKVVSYMRDFTVAHVFLLETYLFPHLLKEFA